MATTFPPAQNLNELVKTHLPLVKRMANKMVANLPANVEVDDLIQSGLMGLVDGAAKFDTDYGVEFPGYAVQRIRGSMIDELRRQDYLPRYVRDHQKTISRAKDRLTQSLGRVPTEGELAHELSLSIRELQIVEARLNNSKVLYFEDLNTETAEFLDFFVGGGEKPDQRLEYKQKVEGLARMIEKLPPRERDVMNRIYDEGMRVEEIAVILQVHPTRVNQLHAQAVERLRTKLRDHR